MYQSFRRKKKKIENNYENKKTCKPSVKLYPKSRKEFFDRQFFQLQILT